MSKDLCQQVKDLPTEANLHSWIEQKAGKYKFSYLLAHADDGVIWGRFDDDKLRTSDQVDRAEFKRLPPLKFSTLQQCRLFGKSGEILLWNSYGKLNARLFTEIDRKDQNLSSIEETQLLWGTHGIQQDGFTLLRDGAQGLRHAIPMVDGINIGDKGQLNSKACLVVNHYIEYNEDGLARINLSRLVELKVIGGVK